METIFNLMYFLVKDDPQYPSVRDYFLGLNGAESTVFINTQLLCILISLIVCLFFYLVCNRVWKMNYIWAWLLALALSGLGAFAIAYTQVGSYVYQLPDPIEAAGWKFISLSIFWAMLYFYLFSLAIKNASIFAKKIPHRIKFIR